MMDASKLTGEQIEEAAKAAYGVFSDAEWLGSPIPSEFMRGLYRSAMVAAAPFLQLPIEEPTREEFQPIYNYCADKPSDGMLAFRIAVEFVRRRNASLLPKPDPRREALEGLFYKKGYTATAATLAAECMAALAALDKEGK